MKHILMTTIAAIAIAAPALAADKTIGNITIAEADWNTLTADIAGFKAGETGVERAERLVTELVELSADGKRYGSRWNTIVGAANSEGWGEELNDFVLVAIKNAAGPTQAEYDQVNAELDLYYDKYTNIYMSVLNGEYTYNVLAPDATAAMVQEAWDEYNMGDSIAETVEEAFKDGYSEGYSDGYEDGFADGYVAGAADESNLND